MSNGQKQDKLGVINLVGKIIEPLDDHVLVERGVELGESPGAHGSRIIIPQATRSQMNHQIGFVKAVGPGQWGPNGERLPTGLKPGDKVVFTKYAGTEADVQGTELLLMRRAEIIARIVDDPAAKAKPATKPKAKARKRKKLAS